MRTVDEDPEAMNGTANVVEKNEAMSDKTNGDVREGDSMVKDDAMMEDEGDKMMGESRYMDYSSDAFDSASDSSRVLFFHASWCPTCRPADADLTKNSNKIPEDVTVFKADYDTEKALKSKYGVTYQHTFVQVDSNGELVTKWSGGSLQELIENIVL
jgi:thiol-disulfide isomerase/thioredoxin